MANTYKVYFYGNGGSVSPSSKTVTVGERYGELATATRANYIFAGWFTKSTGGDEVTPDNSAVVAHIFETIPKIAAAEGLKNGYRIISNVGDDACQSVHHMHFHILGGKKLPESLA